MGYEILITPMKLSEKRKRKKQRRNKKRRRIYKIPLNSNLKVKIVRS